MFGSPLKQRMFSCTQRSAITMSFRPLLPGLCLVAVAKNPVRTARSERVVTGISANRSIGETKQRGIGKLVFP